MRHKEAWKQIIAISDSPNKEIPYSLFLASIGSTDLTNDLLPFGSRFWFESRIWFESSIWFMISDCSGAASQTPLILLFQMEYTRNTLHQYRDKPLEFIQWMDQEKFLNIEHARCYNCEGKMFLHCIFPLFIPISFHVIIAFLETFLPHSSG